MTDISIKAVTAKLVEKTFSFPCPGCREKYPAEKNVLCPDCLESINFVSPPFCPGCGGELSGILEFCEKCLKADKRPWTKAISVFNMERSGKRLIHNFKYHGTPELARALGILAADALKKSGLEIDFIVPTPLHWTRSIWRGFNQAELLCEIISRETQIPVKAVLARKKKTRQQAKLNKIERKNNLMGAFSLKKEEICKNRTILLVDDVMTTGSTLTAASEVLLEAGCKEINVLVLARR